MDKKLNKIECRIRKNLLKIGVKNSGLGFFMCYNPVLCLDFNDIGSSLEYYKKKTYPLKKYPHHNS